jgi:hypothetical protein
MTRDVFNPAADPIRPLSDRFFQLRQTHELAKVAVYRRRRVHCCAPAGDLNPRRRHCGRRFTTKT